MRMSRLLQINGKVSVARANVRADFNWTSSLIWQLLHAGTVVFGIEHIRDLLNQDALRNDMQSSI